jgi:hypothetical protein
VIADGYEGSLRVCAVCQEGGAPRVVQARCVLKCRYSIKKSRGVDFLVAAEVSSVMLHAKTMCTSHTSATHAHLLSERAQTGLHSLEMPAGVKEID